uniref:Secreted protein n=1 Tax=Macrostomum lignano TaxID=282301 RepID=A0A1I8FQU0_9PLAT
SNALLSILIAALTRLIRNSTSSDSENQRRQGGGRQPGLGSLSRQEMEQFGQLLSNWNSRRRLCCSVRPSAGAAAFGLSGRHLLLRPAALAPAPDPDTAPPVPRRRLAPVRHMHSASDHCSHPRLCYFRPQD